MDKETRTKLLDKQMTRRDFLQFVASSTLILFGFSNILALLNHTKKVTDYSPEVTKQASTGFGSHKFGV